ncbi:hypothetical protein L218DRAFT_1000927 [Marasmius fiardii PR-910]|nr:hypothetical protein L218DRAFT_1000927 [Marasmius fiardii PR-910]
MIIVFALGYRTQGQGFGSALYSLDCHYTTAGECSIAGSDNTTTIVETTVGVPVVAVVPASAAPTGATVGTDNGNGNSGGNGKGGINDMMRVTPGKTMNNFGWFNVGCS